MITYEDLLEEVSSRGIIINEKAELPKDYEGFYIETENYNVILLGQGLDTTLKKKQVLGEELGHFYTTVGDITDQSNPHNRKQELRARKWGYERVVPIAALIKGLRYPCTTFSELADYLSVDESYLAEAITYYQIKYGEVYETGRYRMFFNPLKVLEL